jgi:uncharacterized membrane protein
LRLDSAAHGAARAGEWLRLALDAVGGLVIAVGAAVTLARVAWLVARGASRFESERLLLARFLAWALEFQLAADIVDTAIAPDWTKIGQVAAIAAIRTGLNLALRHEIDAERRQASAGP